LQAENRSIPTLAYKLLQISNLRMKSALISARFCSEGADRQPTLAYSLEFLRFSGVSGGFAAQKGPRCYRNEYQEMEPYEPGNSDRNPLVAAPRLESFDLILRSGHLLSSCLEADAKADAWQGRPKLVAALRNAAAHEARAPEP
jgi:hypothetical protein